MGIRKLAAVVLLAVSALAGTVTAAHAASVGQFTGSHSRLWWDGATCRAFAAGDVHSMVLDSRRADTYLRVDVRQLVHDVKVRAPREVQQSDAYYVWADCHYSGDQGD